MLKQFSKGEPVSEAAQSAARMNMLVDAINTLWSQTNAALSDQQGSTRLVIFKVTSAVEGEAGRYEGDVYAPGALASVAGDVSNDELGDAIGGTSIGVDLASIGGASSFVAGDIVPGRVLGIDNEGRRIVLLMTSSADGKLVPVSVSQTGGDAGGADSACTFTYTWTDPAGEEHTESAPLWHRQEGRAGAYIAGEHGLAARGEDGAWVLLVVDETPDVGAGADGGWGGGGDCGCCDPAPCECAEGVTAATLTVTGHVRVTHTSHGLICDSDFSIPYTPNADEPPVSCLWGGPYVLRWATPFVTFEPGITEGQVPAQVTYAEVRLDTSLCQWTLGFGTPCGAGIKTTGNQPMGVYSDSTCSESGYTFEFTDLEVTE